MSWLSRHKRRTKRGTTLVEVLVAGAILAVGMTAIAAMLNESVYSSRMAVRKTGAAEVGISTLERLASTGYDNLAPGEYDGGRYTDDAGTLLYRVTYLVDAGGQPASSYYVEVSVIYKDNLQRDRTQIYGTVVSDPTP